MFTQAVVIREFGGPEVLKLEDVELPELASDEVRIKQTAIGVNFIDTYFRKGLYSAQLPFMPGEEGVGIVEETGSSVSKFKSGDRVTYTTNFHRSYIKHKIIKETELVSVPDNLGDAQVASSLLRGLTAEYLLFRCYKLQAGQSVMVHAAAGGMGAILCQWAKLLGARVFGTVGNENKVKIANQYGCDEVINYSNEDFLTKIKQQTNGGLLDVVYDGVGKTTLNDSLRCVKPRGLLVSYGNASGVPSSIDVLDLAGQGSIFLTRPKLADYICNHIEYKSAVERYLSLLQKEEIKLPETIEMPLKEASNGHQILEDRNNTKMPVLIPE